MTKEELLKEMEIILETKGEKALEAFVLEHFTELPEDVQGKALMSFYTEALEREAGDAQIAQIQKEGLDAMEKIAAMKQEASASSPDAA